jgi:flagellar biosynthesis protein FlhA
VLNALNRVAGRHGDLVLVVLMVCILIVLFTPIPSQLLDFLILANFCFALLLLLLTFYMEKPVEFSTFPSLLLIATLFRLSLNIAASRLIFANADAGKVIAAMGAYVVGGNYIVGLIVFVILVVVQYVVVTNGAQRVAEVAARFTLDSMPGQQMSIDADLNMGFIDQAEAQRRRKNLEKEANFYGAMDGASKFVKGDAIAGIIILLVDIVGGLSIGIAQLGMRWDEALQTFTLLTIGDGIVTQVPALVIAVGTGIIVTRSASDDRLSAEITKQVLSYPKTLGLVGFALVGLMVLPGIPVAPVLVLIVIAAIMGFYAFRRALSAASADKNGAKKAPRAEGDELYDMLTIEPIEARVGQNLIPLLGGDDQLLIERISAFRKQYALDFGFVVPKVRIRDDKKLAPNAYQICIFGVSFAQGELLADRTLAIHPGTDRRKLAGVETKDPTYGLPAVWITEDQRPAARSSGYTLVDPTTVFITHLSEVVRQHAAELLTRAETERLVARVRQSQPGLVDELVPAILTLSEVQKVLQNLLREKVPIRNLEAVLEVLADAGRQKKDAELLTELARHKLGSVICQTLSSGGPDLHVLTFDPAVESAIASGIKSVEERATLVLEPKFAEQVVARMAAQVERMMKSNMLPVLLCAPELRRHVRQITQRVLPHLAVVSLTEVPNNVNLRSFGVVTV